MKFLKNIFKTAICAAVGVFALTGCTNYGKLLKDEPHEYISTVCDNTLSAMAKNNFSEEYSILSEAVENGSLTFELEVEGIKLSGEGYASAKDGMESQMITLTGSKGTSAQVYAYGDKGSVKIGTIGNSGTHIYSIPLDTLEEKIKASIFAPESGSAFSLTQEDFDMILAYLAGVNEAVTEGASPEDKYIGIINSYVEANPPTVEEKIDTQVEGEDVKANIITYNIPKEDLRSLLEQFFDAAAEDGMFKSEYETEVLYYELGYYDEDAGVPTEEEFYAQLKEEMFNDFDSMNDCSVSAVYKINSSTNTLMQFEVSVIGTSDMSIVIGEEGTETDEMKLGAVLGADPANSEKQSIYFEINYDYSEGSRFDDRNLKITADITGGENSSEMLLSMDENGENTELLKITSSKDGENYTVSAEIPDLDITAKMEGTVVTESDSFKMTIDKVSAISGSTEVSYMPKAVVTVKKGGEILALDAEKEFLDITEEELNALIENIGNDFSAVFEEIAESSEAE